MAYQVRDPHSTRRGAFLPGDPPDDLIADGLALDVLAAPWRPRDRWCEKLRLADRAVEAKLANGGRLPDDMARPDVIQSAAHAGNRRRESYGGQR